MSKRKIADCINIRINVGDYQHIEIVKYAEEEIDYGSDADRIAQEDSLRNSLVESMQRSLRYIPEKLKKGQAEAIEVEQSIARAIPAWLANDPVPNIANSAKKTFNTVVDKQQSAKNKAEKDIKDVLIEKSELVAPQKEILPTVKDSVNVDEDLFEEDNFATKKTEKTEKKKDDKVNDGFDLFDNDGDLFGEK